MTNLRNDILEILSRTSSTFEEILNHVSSNSDELATELFFLESEGFIYKASNHTYFSLEKEGLLFGELRMHPNGFGFVEKMNIKGEDIYIPDTELNGAIHGDHVVVKTKNHSKGKSLEGKIISIAKRNCTKIVGAFFENGAMSFVKPDDSRFCFQIIVPKECKLGAVNGHKVIVELFPVNREERVVMGKIIEILGHKNDPGVDILSIIHQHGINIEFSPDTLEQANSISEIITEEEILQRRDLRNKTIVTIDGEDAKDLDDAVAVELLENGNYLLGVHIADVSYYVRENSPLDRDAFERGTSVYLVDRVIPMLPHRLSNGICSLNPQVDRLTLSCEMEFSKTGELISYDIFESVIKTTERMTYTDVRKILLEEDEEVILKYKKLVPLFKNMASLAEILRRKRFDRGSIDFDIKETKVSVDENGKPIDIYFRERSVAEKLIEDFMLSANETIAYHFSTLGLPFIYRIHDNPKEDKLRHLFDFITRFGFFMKGDAKEIHSKQIQYLLTQLEGREEEDVIRKLLLRSMQQAKYSSENRGHFGLAAPFYTHFTSPIRRYPDLIVHRLIRELLIKKNQNPAIISHYFSVLEEIAEHSSQRERRAVEAERDTNELKKTEFMTDKIGKEFNGIISSVTNFGFFVELENTVEGLVHVMSLEDDHYKFDERNLALVGKRTGKKFFIGQKVKVRLVSTDLLEHTIDFEVIKADVPTFISKPQKPKRSFQKTYNQKGNERHNDKNQKTKNQSPSQKPKKKNSDRKSKFDNLYK